MKLKSLLGALIVMGAMAAMSVCAQAAVYTVETVTAKSGSTVTLNINAAPDTDEESITVNAFAMNIGYEETELTPVSSATDATGANAYALPSEATQGGVMVADKVEDGTGTSLAIGWAAAEPVTITEETSLASVTFNVADSASTSTLSVALVQLANDADTLADVDSVKAVGGQVIIADDFMYGDVDGSDTVTFGDAALVAQHAAGIIQLEDIYIDAADVDGTDTITFGDAALIAQRASNIISSFPAETSN